jgi:hypothetical protein
LIGKESLAVINRSGFLDVIEIDEVLRIARHIADAGRKANGKSVGGRVVH